jgi:hypothetical protein
MHKPEEMEQEMVDSAEQQLPPELIQLAGAVLQAFLSGDRESMESLYEMYHEPDKFVERQREAVKEMLRELLADGKISAEVAQQIQSVLDNQSGEMKPADEQTVQTPSADEQDVAIPENQQRSVNPRGKTLHEIMGITR